MFIYETAQSNHFVVLEIKVKCKTYIIGTAVESILTVLVSGQQVRDGVLVRVELCGRDLIVEGTNEKGLGMWHEHFAIVKISAFAAG